MLGDKAGSGARGGTMTERVGVEGSEDPPPERDPFQRQCGGDPPRPRVKVRERRPAVPVTAEGGTGLKGEAGVTGGPPGEASPGSVPGTLSVRGDLADVKPAEGK